MPCLHHTHVPITERIWVAWWRVLGCLGVQRGGQAPTGSLVSSQDGRWDMAGAGEKSRVPVL